MPRSPRQAASLTPPNGLPLDPSVRRRDGSGGAPSTIRAEPEHARWSWAACWSSGHRRLFWTLSAARGLGEPPPTRCPSGRPDGFAAVMAVGVWHLTGPCHGRRAKDRSRPPTSPASPLRRRYAAPRTGVPRRPIDPRVPAVRSRLTVYRWNLLRGTLLYLAIAGVSYGRRAEAARGAGGWRGRG